MLNFASEGHKGRSYSPSRSKTKTRWEPCAAHVQRWRQWPRDQNPNIRHQCLVLDVARSVLPYLLCNVREEQDVDEKQNMSQEAP